MTVPSLPDSERLTSYTVAVASVGPYSVGFDIYCDDDDLSDAAIEVWVDGVQLAGETDYTVSSVAGGADLSIIARPITDAQITFTTARSGEIKIVGARRPRQASQFTNGVSITADQHNRRYTDLMAISREFWDLKSRIPIVAPGEVPTIGSAVSSLALASQAEAEAGTNNTKAMTPLRTKNAIQGGAFFTQTGTGASDRTLIAKLKDFALTPEDFGAAGDGATDDRAPLQECIDEAAATGRPVLLKSKYMVSENGSNGYCILISKSIRMFGSGTFLSGIGAPWGWICPLGTIANTVKIVEIDGATNFDLNFLHLEGFRVGDGTNGHNAIYIDTLSDGAKIGNCLFKNLRCDSRTGVQAFLHDNTGSTTNIGGFYSSVISGGRYTNGLKFINTGPDILVEHIYSLGGNIGVEMTQIAGATDFKISHCLFENTAGCIKLDTCTNPTIEANAIEPSSGAGSNGALIDIGSTGVVTAAKVFWNTIINTSTDVTLLNNVLIGANATHTLIDGNYFNSNNTTQESSPGCFINNQGDDTEIRKQRWANTTIVAGDREVISTGSRLRLDPAPKITTIGDASITLSTIYRGIWLTTNLTAARTLTLPAASSFAAGEVISFRDRGGHISSTNTLTFSRAGSDTVDGATSVTLFNARVEYDLISDGVSRWISGVRGLQQGGTGAAITSVAALRQHIDAYGSVVTQLFNANGTYTPTTGMLHCIIEAVGGGGGGGGCVGAVGNSTAGGGGGGGGYSKLLATAATIGASQTVTIGGGGNGGGAGANNGAAGSDTSVGALCIGKGGSGGLYTSTGVQFGLGGAGGIAGTGTYTPAGKAGFAGFLGAITSIAPSGGRGGDTVYGSGANGSAVSGTGGFAGNAAGANSGGGGSGGVSVNQATDRAGGNGGSGVVIITEFCE